MAADSQHPEPMGSPDERILPATRRAMHDVYFPDAAADEQLASLIDQLRNVNWPRSGSRTPD